MHAFTKSMIQVQTSGGLPISLLKETRRSFLIATIQHGTHRIVENC